ncbi:MAG: ATP synthase F1 subunit epsilon [Lachnospiraceae bacterium]|nr:ATP synthase F1 subunit epsilon [Lachnospiraceae bacterium]
MTQFHLKIVTPDGSFYDGEAEMLSLRTAEGDLGILANHIDLVTPIGIGEARITADGKTRHAACIGGLLSVAGGAVSVVATTFEWAEDIDLLRAQAAEEKARERLQNPNLSKTDRRIQEAKYKRAVVRISVADNHRSGRDT